MLAGRVKLEHHVLQKFSSCACQLLASWQLQSRTWSCRSATYPRLGAAQQHLLLFQRTKVDSRPTAIRSSPLPAALHPCRQHH